MSLSTALAALGALTSVAWVVALFGISVMARRIRLLSEVDPPSPERWPRVSVVVPACNEAGTLRAAVTTLLEQDYPDLELVLINDRSTDGTDRLIDEIAAGDARVRALHIRELPEGWLGKVHALQTGVAATSGDFLLFTDADVHFSATALRRALAYATERQLDHLCIIPDLQSESFLTNLCVASALRSIAVSQKPWRAEDPLRKEAIGSGAFNLVRREAFLATEGFSWLRMEVADDLGLGYLMKRSGAKVGVLGGAGDVRVSWYGSLAEAFRGMEKNAFAQIARFSPARGVGLSVVVALVTLGPFLTFLPLGVPYLWIGGAAALGSNLVSALVLYRWVGFSPLAFFLSAPFGDLIVCAVVVRASLLGARRGGLIWRGTVYPVVALRAGARVRF